MVQKVLDPRKNSDAGATFSSLYHSNFSCVADLARGTSVMSSRVGNFVISPWGLPIIVLEHLRAFSGEIVVFWCRGNQWETAANQ
jgi:hypothetical protein